MREQQHIASSVDLNTIEIGVLTFLRRLHAVSTPSTPKDMIVREQYHMCLSYLTKVDLKEYSDESEKMFKRTLKERMIANAFWPDQKANLKRNSDNIKTESRASLNEDVPTWDELA